MHSAAANTRIVCSIGGKILNPWSHKTRSHRGSAQKWQRVQAKHESKAYPKYEYAQRIVNDRKAPDTTSTQTTHTTREGTSTTYFLN